MRKSVENEQKPGRGRPASGRENLLEAAVKTFARNGYRKTTMDEIASEAGIAKGTFYNYFKDKKDLYTRACAHAMLRWQNEVKDRVSRAKGALEKFYVLGHESFQYLVDHPEVRKLLQDDPELFPLFQPSSRYPEIESDAVKMLRDVIVQGIKEGVFRKVDIDAVTRVLFSIYRMFIVKAYLEYPDFREEELLDVALDLLTEGLGAKKRK